LKRLPFGLRGLNPLSVEALYRRGLLQELEVPKRLKDPHANAVQGPRRQVGHSAGIPIHSGNVDTSQWRYRLPASTDTSLISEMEELETVLAWRSAEVRFGSGDRATRLERCIDTPRRIYRLGFRQQN
jgi:hypothetical protein